jgi:hypothetical protein
VRYYFNTVINPEYAGSGLYFDLFYGGPTHPGVATDVWIYPDLYNIDTEEEDDRLFDNLIYPHQSSDAQMWVVNESGSNVAGRATAGCPEDGNRGRGGWIVGSSEAQNEELLAHEFGHVCTLGHANDSDNIMFWQLTSSRSTFSVAATAAGGSPCNTASVVNQYSEIYGYIQYLR